MRLHAAWAALCLYTALLCASNPYTPIWWMSLGTYVIGVFSAWGFVCFGIAALRSEK